ncbi:MAG TPA: hypothetical protein DDW65_21640 [Firmicutes bacterium]|jgi:hypothetical protein|nr:hypothetical protein [Bacillota bacterium]
MKIPAYAFKVRERFYSQNNILGAYQLGLPGAEVTIATPWKFKIEAIEIGNEDRAADGTLKVDNIAIKKKFILTYKILTEAQRIIIQTELDRKVSLSFKYLTFTNAVSCLSFPMELSNVNSSLPVWKNAKLELKEE